MHWREVRGRYHLVLAGLLAIACAVPIYSLVTAQKPELPLEVAAERVSVTEAISSTDTGVFSHQKLLQTAVAKTGAPVYRFVECRHLPKEESKLVQVGLSSDGVPMYRLKRGDYCLFTGASTTLDTRTQMIKTSSIRREVSSDLTRARTIFNRADLNAGLSPVQQYVCDKFGPACRLALAIQLAENPSGACEIYHYNSSDGTLDWGYFQINSVHLKTPGLNLKDLLDCKANIDYAYRLFLERGFAPWTTYTSGAYRKFLPSQEAQSPFTAVAQHLSIFRPVAAEQ